MAVFSFLSYSPLVYFVESSGFVSVRMNEARSQYPNYARPVKDTEGNIHPTRSACDRAKRKFYSRVSESEFLGFVNRAGLRAVTTTEDQSKAVVNTTKEDLANAVTFYQTPKTPEPIAAPVVAKTPELETKTVVPVSKYDFVHGFTQRVRIVDRVDGVYAERIGTGGSASRCVVGFRDGATHLFISVTELSAYLRKHKNTVYPEKIKNLIQTKAIGTLAGFDIRYLTTADSITALPGYVRESKPSRTGYGTTRAEFYKEAVVAPVATIAPVKVPVPMTRKTADKTFVGVVWPDGRVQIRLRAGGDWVIERTKLTEIPVEITQSCDLHNMAV